MDSELARVVQNGAVTAFSWDADRQKFVYAAKPLETDLAYLKINDAGDTANGLVRKGTVFPESIVPLLTSDATIRIRDFLVASLALEKIAYRALETGTGRPDDEAVSTAIDSAPLGTLLPRLMRKSINRYAEALVVQIGRNALRSGNVISDYADAADGAYAAGLARINRTAQSLVRGGGALVGAAANVESAMATFPIQLVDGCGLSRSSRVTPRSMLQALAGLQANALLFPHFLAMAAVSGEPGTLQAFTGKALAGKVYGKTGTLNDAFHLVGFFARPDAKKPGVQRWTPFTIYSDRKALRTEGLNAMGAAFARVSPPVSLE